MKKIDKFALNYHNYSVQTVQPLVLRILRSSIPTVTPEIPVVKNYLSRGGNCTPPYAGSIAPMCTQILHYFTIAIIIKYFQFQSDWLKIILIRQNCTQFCPIPLCQRNKKFRATAEPLERYALKSNHHEFILRSNLI